tara:strand:+ start:403 stop:570 length:168 start_codon:yes stop_codon:yes gene_type:complete
MKEQKGGGVIDKLLLPLGLIGVRKLVYFKKAFNNKNKTKKNTSKNKRKSKKYRKK